MAWMVEYRTGNCVMTNGMECVMIDEVRMTLGSILRVIAMTQ